MTDPTHQPGREALWAWFGLSYAAWLTIPRVLMHEMPDDWQARLAQLLQEWDAAWWPSDGLGDIVVNRRIDGRFSKWPEGLLNYRHPDPEFLATCTRPGQSVDTLSARG